MKRITTILLAMFLFAGLTQAQVQEKSSFGVGFDLALPSGDMVDALDLSTGFGGDARFEYRMTHNFNALADIGYYMWGGEEFDGGSTDLSDVAIALGGKYYFNRGLYGTAEVGMHFLSYEWSYDDGGIFDDFETTREASESEFGFAFGAGYEVPLSKKTSLDLGAKYQIINDFNNIVVRTALKFNM